VRRLPRSAGWSIRQRMRPGRECAAVSNHEYLRVEVDGAIPAQYGRLIRSQPTKGDQLPQSFTRPGPLRRSRGRQRAARRSSPRPLRGARSPPPLLHALVGPHWYLRSRGEVQFDLGRVRVSRSSPSRIVGVSAERKGGADAGQLSPGVSRCPTWLGVAATEVLMSATCRPIQPLDLTFGSRWQDHVRVSTCLGVGSGVPWGRILVRVDSH